MKNTINAAQEANFAKHLKSLVRRQDGQLMDMASYLLALVLEGRTGQVAERQKYHYDRRKYNNMDYREQKEYDEKLKITITDCRAVHPEGHFVSLTRSEYDYFLKLIEQHRPETEIGPEYATEEELKHLFKLDTVVM